jgi:hypothetical protein
VEIVNNETIPREEDELGVPAQDAADEKQVGRRSPAVAGEGEGGMLAAAETARESYRYARAIEARTALS